MNPEQQAVAGRDILAWRFFQLAMFTLPWVGLGVLTTLTGRDLGAGLQPAWLFLALAVILQGPELAGFLVRHRRVWLPIAGPWLLATILSVLGLWHAPSGETVATALFRFGKQSVQLVIMLFFVLVPAYYLARGMGLGAVARPVVWGAVFQLAYSLWQGVHFWYPMDVFVGLENLFTSNPAILSGSEQLYLGNVLQEIPRLRGTACEPLYLGNFLLLAIPLVALTGWSARRRGVVVALLLLLLLLTWSRGAWLAAAFGVVIAVVVGRKFDLLARRASRLRPVSWLLILVLAVVGAGAVIGWSEVLLPWRRLWQSFSMSDWSNLTRLYSMQAAWRGFLLSPLVGLGWGQFGFHFALLVDPMGLQSMFSWPVVNNFPLQILCECGVLGAAGFVWLWARILARCPACWRQKSERAQPLLLLVVASGAVWLQLMTFSQYNLPHIWVGVGILVGCLVRPGTTTGVESK